MKRTIIDPSQLELNDKVVAIKRVSKTVKGGRTMRFSALVVVGDGNGHVGAGLGKAGEVPEAIRKGKEAAMKNLVAIPVDDSRSIPHDYIGKFGSASVLLKKAPEGTGVICPFRAGVSRDQEYPYQVLRFQQQDQCCSGYLKRLVRTENSGRGCKTSWQIR